MYFDHQGDLCSFSIPQLLAACGAPQPDLDITYLCPICEFTWHEIWTSACDSECPECATPNIIALEWEEVL